MNTAYFPVPFIILKHTTSRCPICKNFAPATVYKKLVQDGLYEVRMERKCAEHGTNDYLISSDARFYWLAKGDDANRGWFACPSEGRRQTVLGSNSTVVSKLGSVEKLSTCLALIEIVDSCNLSCPTCYADSPLGSGQGKTVHKSFEDLTERIQAVIDRKGHIEVLQFSGGEPTIHPDFFRLVEWVRSNPRIDYLLINTNGVRLARDKDFLRRMGEIYSRFDNIQLYLQFDGPQAEGQEELRGTDLRRLRKRAIENCGKINLPITLAMTVSSQNLGYLWDTVSFALGFEHVRGVSFQPLFLSGRNSAAVGANPINVADIIIGLNGQSEGKVKFDDWTPLPCGDPNCATIGWIFRLGGRTYSPSESGIDIPELQSHFPDRVNYNIDDLRKCGCDGTALGELMKRLELKESNAFRLFIKPFMDARSWDEDRIDRCCTHVITPEGKLDSFCRYYFGAPPGAEKKKVVL